MSADVAAACLDCQPVAFGARFSHGQPGPRGTFEYSHSAPKTYNEERKPVLIEAPTEMGISIGDIVECYAYHGYRRMAEPHQKRPSHHESTTRKYLVILARLGLGCGGLFAQLSKLCSRTMRRARPDALY